jgi:hypothetical protein
MTTYRLYPSTNGPSSSSGDPGSYTMGLSFMSTISGATLTGYYWWVADAAQNILSMNFGLWQVTGPGTGIFQSGSEATIGDDLLTIGWNFIALSPGFSLIENQEYRAVCNVYAGGGSTSGYSATSHFWDTGAGAAGITSGPISAYCGAGGTGTVEPADAAQMSFDSGGTNVTVNYPASAFNAANYWLDVQVTGAVPPGPEPPLAVVYSMRTFP